MSGVAAQTDDDIDATLRRDTPLARALAQRIRRDGPVTVAQYVSACLQDPAHGYYRHARPLGRAGDFITAPEISQVFGELLGLWAAVTWQQMGSPARVRLVEFGPGRGTLMADALRATQLVPAFLRALEVVLVETSVTLHREQEARLARAGVPMTWHASLDELHVDVPVIVLANEFLDTEPAIQYVRAGAGWREQLIGLDAAGRLQFLEPGAAPPHGVDHDRAGQLDAMFPATPEGGIVEHRDFPDLRRLLARVAEVASPLPFAALFLDYGSLSRHTDDTLQAVRAHVREHPLASPGEADVTQQVAFADVTDMAASLAVDGPVTQAQFLGSLGIVERARRLMAANPARAAEIEAGVARLMAPTGMGARFKAIGLRSRTLPPLAGLSRSA